ncbi:MAG: hypothetical protein FWD73_11735 [Polyangiaceae bacterium]|nr:hypothetical protein [Polyangiaceae bacterium]
MSRRGAHSRPANTPNQRANAKSARQIESGLRLAAMMLQYLAPIVFSCAALTSLLVGCGRTENEAPPAGGGASCTLIGCADTATLNAHLAAAPAELDGAAVTACWQQMCATASLPTLTGQGAAYFAMQGDGIRANGLLESDGNGVYVEVTVSPLGTVANGDSYRLSVVDASGQTLLNGQAIATYTILQPNGPDCDPTCHTATFSFDSLEPW